MAKRHRIVKDEVLTEVVKLIVKKLGFNYIDVDRVAVVRNLDSNSNAYARIYAMPRPIAVAFDLKPLYAIEVIHRRFEKLDCESKLGVLIHELLHIPKSFSGSLVPHHPKTFSPSNIERMVKKLDREKLCSMLEYK